MATPSLRLIPKGEKSDTFTDLALAPFEGCTWRGVQLAEQEKNLIALPPGYALIKVGGRPKKEARDAAVFLAKFWRKEAHGESSTVAEKWVVDTWELAGSLASKGISETAHVRAAIKRARGNGLNQSMLLLDHKTGVCTAIEGEKQTASYSLTDGARAWVWVSGMTEAAEATIKNLQTRIVEQPFSLSPIFKAVRGLAEP